jgi:sugar fermentation stimulation protein A
MIFDPPLQPGTLVQRYKRFLADVELPNGEVVTAHCPNPGSMKTCAEPGWRAWLSPATNPSRKLKWTLELVEAPSGLILVNTSRPNRIVEEGIQQGRFSSLASTAKIQREVRYGENSRIDLLLEEPGQKKCWVEVKSVTMLLQKNLAAFPDSVTKRGSKHLVELVEQVRKGDRAVQLFLVSRQDVDQMCPAVNIDPVYAKNLRWAASEGVEIVAHKAHLDPREITVGPQIPVLMEPKLF